jgi:DNA-binding HxlR family transcriptional regulator/putative sterol carrier protein
MYAEIVSGRRTYHDGCAAAHALNLLGERWALLVVRELMLGPKRFADLRRSLPGISANVLTQRLEELEASGVLRRRALPPPASVQVYELSPWGYELEPVFRLLGRWGARSPELPHEWPVSVTSTILSMRTMFDPARAGDLRLSLDLRLGPERFRVAVAEGRLDAERGEAERPDVTLATDPDTLVGLLYGGADVEAAVATGTARLEGDAEALRRFLGAFGMPEPVASA